MKNKSKLIITVSTVLTIALVFFVSFPFWVYLKLLPELSHNSKFLDAVKTQVENSLGADLVLKNLDLQTSMKSEIFFSAQEITLTKEGKKLFSVKDLDFKTSFKRLLEKHLDLQKLGAASIYVDVDGLMTLVGEQKTEQKPSDFDINWLDSLLYVKECFITYSPMKDVRLTVKGKDLEITSSRKPKYVHFKFDINLENKNKSLLSFRLWDQDRVYIQNKRLYLNDFMFFVERSPIFLKIEADDDKKFSIYAYSDKFDVKNAVRVLESNLIIPNGKEILSYFKDINGTIKFRINLNPKKFGANLSVNKAELKIIPLADLPIYLTKGSVVVTDKDIYLKDFNGYYGSSAKLNKADMNGVVKDYMKTVQADIKIRGLLTNDFAKNYLSKLAGCPFEILGNAGTVINIKINYDKVDIDAFTNLKAGEDILIAGLAMTPKMYQRALRGQFHFEKNILDIKNIDYYIADKISMKNFTPAILKLKGVVNVETLEIQKMGFEIPKPLPSEFLNLFVGSGFFKKGTISGKLGYNNEGKIPIVDGNLVLDGVRIPSQRLGIKKGVLKTDNNLIHIDAQGRYRKSKYQFSGDIKNQVLFPIVVKDVDLTVGELNVEKILQTFNSDVNAAPPATVKFANDNISNEEESDANVYTFNPNILIVERCMFNVVKGSYKEIDFGDLHANLTLSKDGILQVQSNKFNFAQGISSLKVYCDLNKHKYSIRLGAKDINSDLIATVILGFKKEISGKASALLEFYTDDSMKLNGSIKFIVKDGSIAKLGLVQYILKVAALFRNPIVMISPSTVVDLVNIPDGMFRDIIGFIDIRDNVITRINIKSSSPQLSSLIAGRYNLETRDASLRIFTKFSSSDKGFSGFLRNFSLNALAYKMKSEVERQASYYAAEINMIPKLDIGEETSQIFLTTVEGDVEHNNFISSVKKVK